MHVVVVVSVQVVVEVLVTVHVSVLHFVVVKRYRQVFG